MQEVQKKGYVTVSEAARLEGLNFETFRKKIQRNPDEFDLITESSESGGKDRIWVAVTCLSLKARKEHRAKEKIVVTDFSKKQSQEMPWYIDIDLNWYIENYKKHYYTAVELSKTIAEHIEELQDIPHNEKTDFSMKMAKKLNMSWGSFYRKMRDYMKACAWAEKIGRKCGSQTEKNYEYFKVLAFARDPREKDNFPSLTEEMKALIENLRFNQLVSENQWKVKKIYRCFEEKAAEKCWGSIPSYHTVDRYIKHLLETRSSAEYLLQKGKKAWQGKYMGKKKRDTGALMVLEVVMGDGHTFDCWVEIKRKNGTVDYIRPHLLAWIDLRSRCLVGWAICEIPDSQVIKKSILNMIYEKKDSRLPYGCPKYIYIDNGKDFTAQCLTGRPRTEKFTLDSDVKGFFRGAGIEDDIRAMPYHSFSKAQIERMFGTVCEDFSKESNTYTGTLTGSSTEAKIKRNIKKMGEKGLVESMESLAQRFQVWLPKYHARIHEGLKDQGEAIPKPIEVFNHADRYEKPAPPLDFAESLLMTTVIRFVRPEGIKMFKNFYYTHPALSQYRRDNVRVKYDPDDVSVIHVYDKAGKKICDASCYELLKISPKSNERALVEHIKSQHQEYKDMMSEIKYMQMPYEERVDLSEGRKVITPETKGKNPKVVSMPDDKQYRNEARDKKSKDEYQPNEYYLKKSEEFFAKLQNL